MAIGSIRLRRMQSLEIGSSKRIPPQDWQFRKVVFAFCFSFFPPQEWQFRKDVFFPSFFSFSQLRNIPGTDQLLGLMEARLASLPYTPPTRGLARVATLGKLSFRQLALLSRGVPGVLEALAALPRAV